MAARNASSTSLRVDWREVNKSERNGIILGYNIEYTDPEGVPRYDNVTPGSTLFTIVTKLKVLTWYNVSVAAYTKVGLGPRSRAVPVSTDEGSKYLHMFKAPLLSRKPPRK